MRKVLYLGTNKSFSLEEAEVMHYPVIAVISRSLQDEDLKKFPLFTHCFFTSKNTVEILFTLSENGLDFFRNKSISIGPATSEALRKKGIVPLWESPVSSQEGMIDEMQKHCWNNAYIFYPRSSIARPYLASYLQEKKIAHEILDLYDTVFQMPQPIPALDEIDEIIFTSPSTVEGFFRIYSKIPEGKKITFQGPVTERAFFNFKVPI